MKAWRRPDVPPLPDPALTRPGAAPRADDMPERLVVHDTASQGPVVVGPARGTARMYVCGITPYDATHLGHAFTYLTFDLVIRVWRDLGLDVLYAQNVTDVDEPLLERAEQMGVRWEDLALDQTALFRTDMEALRIIPPDHYVGAVESVDDVVRLLEPLTAGSEAAVYQVDDPEFPDWYFDVTRAPDFGGVAHLADEDARARFTEMGGDPERPGKRNPLDCLVWRLERAGEPSWSGGALGQGRPGWHIECTAIALSTLGPHFDVQGGGTDLTFPHHEMSAAQAVVASGEPLAAAFVHSAMVGLDGEKMSKSKGNLELVSRLRAAGVDPMAIRLALLAHHYRTDWEWIPAEAVEAAGRLDLWRRAAALPATADPTATITEIRRSLRRDLDSPRALAAVDGWAESSLSAPQPATPGGGAVLARAVDALLGVSL